MALQISVNVSWGYSYIYLTKDDSYVLCFSTNYGHLGHNLECNVSRLFFPSVGGSMGLMLTENGAKICLTVNSSGKKGAL
jgi:hypothetical protein